MLGEEVITLVHKKQIAGLHEIQWDGKNEHGFPVSTGIYFLRIKASKYVSVKKMVYLK